MRFGVKFSRTKLGFPRLVVVIGRYFIQLDSDLTMWGCISFMSPEWQRAFGPILIMKMERGAVVR